MKLAELLGRDVSQADRESVSSFNELTAEQVDEARRVLQKGRLAAVEYLQFYVVRSALDHVARFIDEVLVAGQPATDWGIESLVCIPKGPIRALLSTSGEDALAPLRSLHGSPWLQCEPSAGGWNWDGFCGAPAVQIERAPYWWEGPKGTDWTWSRDTVTVPLDDLGLGYRRWLASRVAWETRGTPNDGLLSVEAVCARLKVPRGLLSPDALFAIEGLLRETRESATNLELAPGFRGPDEWYR